MRYVLLTSALLLASAATVASAETQAPSGLVLGIGARHPDGIKRTVYLDHVALEDLKKSDPARYAQVQKVMVAASEICGPNAARQWAVANIKSASCSSMLLKTSNPPKREIGFQIDDTWYVALVTVRDRPARLIAAPDKVVPLDPKR
jgi:hypothetical protein